MKWHTFQTSFWDSKTAVLLEAKCGAKGVLIYLRIINRIALDISSADDIRHAIQHGWRKNLTDFARIAKVSNAKLLFFIDSVNELNLFETQLESDLHVKSIKWLTIKIRNLHEFVHPEALSSIDRKQARIELRETWPPDGGQMEANGRPISKVKLSNNNENKKTPKVSNENNTSVPIERITELWNQYSSSKKIKGFFPKRSDIITNFWNERPSEEYWKDIFTRVGRSDFLTRGEKGWPTTIEWVMKNHIEVSEGKYDNKEGVLNAGSSMQIR